MDGELLGTVGYEGAVKLVGVCRRSVQDLVRRGEIPHFRIGRRVLFLVDELVGWMHRKTHGTGEADG